MPETDRTQQDTWDVVVIGGGPPGENAAQYAIAGSDRTAVIVEKELLGGECSFWACMPSKGLLRPIGVLDLARNLPGVKSLVGTSQIDVDAVLRRRDDIVNHHDDASQIKWAGGVGIDVVRGHGRLAGPRTVEVTGAVGSVRTIHARHAVVLATGTTAAVPPIPGLAEALPWTSRDVTNVHEIPRRMAVIGGGVVACEAATWMLGLGVQELTIISTGPGLLGRNEDFAGEFVAEKLRASGATVHFEAEVDSVRRSDPMATGEGKIHGGEVVISFGTGSVSADEVLVATGRVPTSRDIGLDTIDHPSGSLMDATTANHGYVKVDDRLEVDGVGGEWLYAISDLNGRVLLTHMGKYQARICGTVIAARAQGRPVDGPFVTDLADHGMIPQVTFTDPEVASVGVTEAQARESGIRVRAIEYDMAGLAGTYVLRENYQGRAKFVVDEDSQTLVGATFVGPEVAELLHAATVAMVGRVTLHQLWHAVPSYPTVGEVWLRFLETYFNPS